MPTSLNLLPPGLVLPSFIADITCFWIQIPKDPTLGYLSPGHRARIVSIIIRGGRQCGAPERPRLSDHADLGVTCGSTTGLLGGQVIS